MPPNRSDITYKFILLIGRRTWIEPFDQPILKGPCREKVARGIMVTDVVPFEIRSDVRFELCELGLEIITHIDNGIGFVFEPIDEGLIESGLTL